MLGFVEKIIFQVTGYLRVFSFLLAFQLFYYFVDKIQLAGLGQWIRSWHTDPEVTGDRRFESQ